MMDGINHTAYFITCVNPFYDSALFRFINHVSRQSKVCSGPRASGDRSYFSSMESLEQSINNNFTVFADFRLPRRWGVWNVLRLESKLMVILNYNGLLNLRSQS